MQIKTYINRAELQHLLDSLNPEQEYASSVLIVGQKKLPQCHLFLSERNIRTLLSKLDRAAKGESTYCTIIKHDTIHEKFPCTFVTAVTAVEVREANCEYSVVVFAVQDKFYYANREAGPVVPADEAVLNSPHH